LDYGIRPVPFQKRDRNEQHRPRGNNVDPRNRAHVQVSQGMMRYGKIVGRDLSKALTLEQANLAWKTWIAAQFAILATPGGG